MMKCERCGEETYIIFITKEHEKICDKCEEKENKESVKCQNLKNL